MASCELKMRRSVKLSEWKDGKMKRTRKMMLITLMATTAIAMLLMSRALAAPSTCPASGLTAGTTSTSTCPTSSLLNQLIGSSGSNLTTTTGSCPSAATLQQLLNSGALTGCKTGSCPTSGTLQQLLGKYGISMNGTSASCPNGNCPTGTATTGTTATTPAPTPAPTPGSGTTATVPPVTGNMSAEESKMINLVNQDRANNGLKALTFDSSLRAGALAHSQDMSWNNYFSHTSPTLGGFSARLKASGVKYSAAGENIAMYGSVEAAEAGFMNSPGHRANILNRTFTRVGIGIVYNQSKGAYYITQWFAK
jgi:uncharacterized protein YkwD